MPRRKRRAVGPGVAESGGVTTPSKRAGRIAAAPWVLLAAGAIGGAALWRSGGGARPAETRQITTGAAAGASAMAMAMTPPAPPLPTTMRIAGRVTLGGAPVAATLVLSSDATEAGAAGEGTAHAGAAG